MTPVVKNAFTADIKRLQDAMTADQAAELSRLADGLSKTRTPGAIAGDISRAINTDGLKAVAEFKVVRDQLAKIATPDQVRALDRAVMGGVSEDRRDQLEALLQPSTEQTTEETLELRGQVSQDTQGDGIGKTIETDFQKVNNLTPEASKLAREEATARITKIDEKKRIAEINASLQDDSDTPMEKRLRREPAFRERIRELQETGKTDNIELRTFIEQYGSLFGIDNPGNFDFPRTDEIGKPTKILKNSLSRHAQDLSNSVSGQDIDYGQRNKLRVAAADEELSKFGVSKETLSQFSKSERYALDFALQGKVDGVGIPPFMINEQKIAKQFQKDLESGKSIPDATENALKLKSRLGPNPIVDAVSAGNKKNIAAPAQPRPPVQEQPSKKGGQANKDGAQYRLDAHKRLQEKGEQIRTEMRDKDMAERDALNTLLPDSEEDAQKQGFRQSSKWQSAEHQNKDGKPELKYTHPDGREVVFDGDTGKMITDPKIKGTFNYGPEELTLSHIFNDYLPFKMLEEPPKLSPEQRNRIQITRQRAKERANSIRGKFKF